MYCSITGYGRNSAARDRPGYDGLVQARWGIQNEQPGLRPGPVFLHLPLPSFGAALVASVGINAALFTRDHTGRGQWVETSLVQGALAYLTQIWKRAENPTPDAHGSVALQGLPAHTVLRSGRRPMVPPDAAGVSVSRSGTSAATPSRCRCSVR